MQHAIDAIYENGAFRPLHREVLSITEGQQVRITVDEGGDPEALRLAMSVFDGLSDDDIKEIEGIAQFSTGKTSGTRAALAKPVAHGGTSRAEPGASSRLRIGVPLALPVPARIPALLRSSRATLPSDPIATDLGTGGASGTLRQPHN